MVKAKFSLSKSRVKLSRILPKMILFSRFPSGDRFSRANEDLLRAEAAFSHHLKGALTSSFDHVYSDPALSAFISEIQSICDAITRSNSSTSFVSGDLDHILDIHAKFAQKRTELRDLENSLKNAGKIVSNLHSQLLTHQQGGVNTEETRKLRDRLNDAIREEESLRRDCQARGSIFELEFAEYQKDMVRLIATVYGEIGRIRSGSEMTIAKAMKSILDSKLTVSLNFPESDAQVTHEMAKLQKIISTSDKEMVRQISLRSFSSEDDFVLISKEMSEHNMIPDSSDDEDIPEPVEGKPLVEIDFVKGVRRAPSAPVEIPATRPTTNGTIRNSVTHVWHKVCSELRTIKI
jgi:hypothetical protein